MLKLTDNMKMVLYVIVLLVLCKVLWELGTRVGMELYYQNLVSQAVQICKL